MHRIASKLALLPVRARQNFDQRALHQFCTLSSCRNAVKQQQLSSMRKPVLSWHPHSTTSCCQCRPMVNTFSGSGVRILVEVAHVQPRKQLDVLFQTLQCSDMLQQHKHHYVQSYHLMHTHKQNKTLQILFKKTKHVQTKTIRMCVVH